MPANPIAYAPFQGQKLPVYPQRQWAQIRVEKDRMWVSQDLAKNFDKFNHAYEKFCQQKLEKIIQREIDRLKTKTVTFKAPFQKLDKTGKVTDKFSKEVKYSVNEYLKERNFSPTLKFKIGSYEKEWGINQIDPKKKKFTLFFNQNLIKFDSGKHIRHVVAHELSHVFIRDHGPEFHRVLRQLDPTKKDSENFFQSGIRQVFKQPTSASNIWIWISLSLLFLLTLSLLLWYFFHSLNLELLTPHTWFSRSNQRF
jgi:predicted metal-dependent hydrolase